MSNQITADVLSFPATESGDYGDRPAGVLRRGTAFELLIEATYGKAIVIRIEDGSIWRIDRRYTDIDAAA